MSSSPCFQMTSHLLKSNYELLLYTKALLLLFSVSINFNQSISKCHQLYLQKIYIKTTTVRASSSPLPLLCLYFHPPLDVCTDFLQVSLPLPFTPGSLYSIQPGPASWAYDPCSHTGLLTHKDPVLGLMLCCCHLEILDNF